MNLKLDECWKQHLHQHMHSSKFKNLVSFVNNEYRNYTCYPEESLIFQALNCCSFHNVKVVILGQDPYHNPNQANGLSFSVAENRIIPPSLLNIFREIENNFNIKHSKNGDLNRWVEQGVLLLNSTLTVRKNKPGSHQNRGWEKFTDKIIKIISLNKNNVVFLLWGNYAKRKSKLIDNRRHLILMSGHPSPISANRGLWFGNNHFSKTNNFLVEHGMNPINWH